MAHIRIYQQIFAYAAGGYERINDLQIAAVSRDLPPAVSRELRGHVDRYSRPDGMRPGTGPEALRYARLSDGWCAVTCFQDRGIIRDRDGCFLAHSLVFREGSLQANGFNVFPLFEVPEIREDYVDGQTDLPELDVEVPAYRKDDAAPALDTIQQLFGMWDESLYDLLLVSHPSQTRPPKVLLTRGASEELRKCLALVAALSLPPARPGLTFITYTGQPGETNLRFVGNPYWGPADSIAVPKGCVVFGGQGAQLDRSSYPEQAKSYAKWVIQAIENNDWDGVLSGRPERPVRSQAPPRPLYEPEAEWPPRPWPSPEFPGAESLARQLPAAGLTEGGRCARFFRQLESPHSPVLRFELWQEGPGAAVAVVAAQAEAGPAAVAEILVGALRFFASAGKEAPSYVRDLLGQFARGEHGRAALRQHEAGLPKKIKKSVGQALKEPVPNGLYDSVALVRGWQASASGEDLAALREVERRLQNLAGILQKKHEPAGPDAEEPVPSWKLSALRNRFDPVHAALLLAVLASGLSVWNVARTGNLAERIARLEADRDKRSQPTDGRGMPHPQKPATGADQPAPDTNQPSPSPRPGASETVGLSPAPSTPPDPLAEGRRKLRECILDLVTRSPGNGFNVSDLQRRLAPTRVSSDDYLLQLWAHFYVAAQTEGEVVNLKPSPRSLDRLKSDPIYPILSDIFSRREKAEKLLPKVAGLSCPQ